MRSRSIKFAASVSLAAIIAGTSSGAFAQSAPVPQAQQERETDVVVVTGSRIPRPDLTGTSPVSVTSAEQIALDRSVTI
jgi:iron complex outermembrane receptor protein